MTTDVNLFYSCFRNELKHIFYENTRSHPSQKRKREPVRSAAVALLMLTSASVII